MEITRIEENYHILRDECRTNDKCRSFRQLLSEHSLALVDLTIAHACDNKSDIMRQTEKLTELHMEWQSKITKANDTLRWKGVARKAVRKFPYAVMKLMVAVFPGKGELRYTDKQVVGMLHNICIGVDTGSDFHAGWGNLSSNLKEGLKNQYKWYGKMCVKTLAGLKRNGIRSDTFFRAATNSMEAAISLGETLDGV